MILGTESVGQAFRKMCEAMLRAVVDAVTQMLAQWLVYGIAMKALQKLCGISMPDPNEQARKKIAANVTIAQSNAAVAASEAFVEYMPSGLWVALAMAGVADVIGQGFVTQASMKEGGILPKDMLVGLHKQEMVLPPDLSRHVQNMATLYGKGDAGRGAALNQNSLSFVINGATDAKAVGDEVFDRVNRYFKSGGVMR
jgi:hypothetical protein